MQRGYFETISAGDNILPFGVPLDLGFEERAERNDLPTTLTGSIDRKFRELCTHPLPAIDIRHLGVIDDDEARRGAGKGHDCLLPGFSG